MKTLTWIKYRARSIERFYRVERRTAIVEARMDWALFMGSQRLQIVKGDAQ